LPSSEAWAESDNGEVRERLVAISMALGLSPALVELAHQIVSEPASAYVLCVPLLLVSAARRTPHHAPNTLRGGLWVVAALVVEVVAIAAHFDRLARIAIPMSLIGYLHVAGRATWPLTGLTWFIVPVPSAISKAVSLEVAWRRLSEAVVGPTGGTLSWTAGDSGLCLAALLASLGWFLAARNGRSVAEAISSAARLAALALPAQLGFAMVAVALARSGATGLARAFLTFAPPLVACAVVLLPLARPLRAGGSRLAT
jgi:hypothetical protein